MDKKQITENNLLIAKYMGIDFENDLYSWRPGVVNKITISNCGYHENWGWLMPVVLKIISENKSVFIIQAPGYSTYTDLPFVEILPDQKNGVQVARSEFIDAVYVSVVEYLKSKISHD